MDNMDLLASLKDKATLFNKFWKQYFPQAEPANLYQATWHLPSGGGKRLRPIISMLSSECFNIDQKQILPFAAALELLHNFTLVHDDIMDKSTLRRNLQAVHVKFGEPTAILAGDFLFAKAFEALHDLNVSDTLHKELNYDFIQTIKDICIGQQLDIQYEQRSLITEAEYLEMINKKTAVLFGLSAAGGAKIAEANSTSIQAMTDYGIHLGLAFQIWDDYLDLSSNTDTLGKDIGNDIRNGKKTLIAVHALQTATGEDKSLLDRVFGNQQANNSDINKVYALFKELKSIEHARITALTYNNKAKQNLSPIKESLAKQLLTNLADYAIQREK